MKIRKIDQLLSRLENLVENSTDQIISLSDEFAQKVKGGAEYAIATNELCVGNNSTCTNTSCEGSTNGTCSNKGCIS